MNKMNKIMILWVFTLITGFSANAQCTPDTQFTYPGIYPDSVTGFANANVGVFYDQLITNVVPSDSTFMIGPIPVTLTFDSLVVVNITGLPPGFTYNCFDAQNTTSPLDQCAFEGGTTGCIVISGTPNLGDEGIYNLSIEINAFLQGGLTPNYSQVIDYYKIEVLNSTGILENSFDSKILLYPNPTAGNFSVELGDIYTSIDVEMTDVNGKLIQSQQYKEGQLLNITIDEPAGIYLLTITSGDKKAIIRLVKN